MVGAFGHAFRAGADLDNARKRRGLPLRVVTDGAFTSRTNATDRERDVGVGVGIHAAVLHALVQPRRQAKPDI